MRIRPWVARTVFLVILFGLFPAQSSAMPPAPEAELTPVIVRVHNDAGAFGWSADEVDGHDVGAVCEVVGRAMASKFEGPRAVIAHTIKGKGAPSLEGDPLCHIRTLTPEEVEELTGGAP